MQTYNANAPFHLESGAVINDFKIAYHTYGKLNKDRNNVIWVCHALTANSDVFDWWSGLFGAEKLFNPEEHFIVCANIIGSCYGTSGPVSPCNNARPQYDEFPLVTVRDMVNAHELLRGALGINQIDVLIGASLGGQQAQEWAISNPSLIKRLILIATNAKHSPYGIAFNESQRLAIYADSSYGEKNKKAGEKGLIAARSIAMLSYRSYHGYNLSQLDDSDNLDQFRATTYQRYQGEKLAARFNAYSYVVLSKAMDSHNVGRGRNSLNEALGSIKAKTLVVGISSDVLFPLEEQKYMASRIPNANYHVIHSKYGHDGFLLEAEQLQSIFQIFLSGKESYFRPTVFKTTVKKSELISRTSLN